MGYLYIRRPNRRGVTANYGQAWASAVVANGGSVSDPYLDNVEAFIRNLQQDGIWPLLDRLWVFANEGEISAKTDMTMNHDLLTPSAGTPPTFLPLQGYVGVGTTLVSTYNFSNAPNWSQNSGHVMCYIHSAGTTAANAGCGGADNILLFPYSGTSGLFGRINTTTGTEFAVAGPHGCSIISRTGPTTTDFYKDGINIGTDTSASTTVQNQVFCALGASPLNAFADVGFNTYTMHSVGAGLTGPQVTALHNRMMRFLNDIGAT